MELWEQQRDEPNEWFDRFERYRLLGVSRSIEQVYKDEQQSARKRGSARPNSSWYEAAKRWAWQRRAEAFDAFEREQAKVEHEEAKRRAKSNRQKVIKAVESLLVKRISEATKKKTGLATAELLTLANAMKTVLDQSRVEFGEPTDIQGITGGDGGAVEITDSRDRVKRLLSRLSDRIRESDVPGSTDES